MANTWNTVNQPYVNSATYTATSGSVLTAAGLNGTSWANPSVSFTSSNQKSLLTIPHGEDKIVLSQH